MRTHIKIVFSFSVVLALFYIAAFYYKDFNNNQVLHKPCIKKGDDFILDFKRPKLNKPKFWILNLRPGQIYIKTNQKVKNIELVTNKKSIIKTEKVNNHLFKKKIKNNLIISSIKLIPNDSSINRIDIIILRKPFFSIPYIFYQFSFIFIIFYICSLTIYFLYSLIFKQITIQNLPSKMLVYQFIILILIIFIYFALNFDKFLVNFNQSQPLRFFGKTIFFNVVLAILMISLYYVFSLKRRGKKLPYYFPVLISLPIIFYKLPFKINTNGDGLLWIINLINRKTNLFFAESLSLLLAKFSFHFTNSIIHINAKTALIYTGKFMGVLFIFSLFSFVNSLNVFSYKKKLLFFILFLTFSFNALLFGFPDFAYYSLPFLIFSFLSAQKYIGSSNKNIKNLIISAAFVIIAGLFHGSAFFSFPVILLLPLLKYNKYNDTKRILIYLKQYLAILLPVGIIFFLFFMLLKILNFNLVFNKTAGGFDGRQFISFIPANINFPQAVNFIEVGYFISRGWILFISGSFIFLLFLFNWKKRVSLTMSDFILFLFGISQFLVVLFWGFDLGIQDFDLYIAPATLIFLFLLKYFLGMKKSSKIAWKYILIFSLFSPLYLLITKVI